MTKTDLVTLTTIRAVIKKLGGVARVAELTDRSVQNICNFRNRGYFPAILLDKINDPLAERKPGYIAARALFRIEESNYRKSNAA